MLELEADRVQIAGHTFETKGYADVKMQVIECNCTHSIADSWSRFLC